MLCTRLIARRSGYSYCLNRSLLVLFFRHDDRHTAQQQGRVYPMLGDDDLGIVAQRGFHHLELLELLGVTDEVLLGGLVSLKRHEQVFMPLT